MPSLKNMREHDLFQSPSPMHSATLKGNHSNPKLMQRLVAFRLKRDETTQPQRHWKLGKHSQQSMQRKSLVAKGF